jgi:hypothetical protein
MANWGSFIGMKWPEQEADHFPPSDSQEDKFQSGCIVALEIWYESGKQSVRPKHI